MTDLPSAARKVINITGQDDGQVFPAVPHFQALFVNRLSGPNKIEVTTKSAFTS